MSDFTAEWELIPDGSVTVVRVVMKGEFYVRSEAARKEAEDGITLLVSRVTRMSHDDVRSRIEEGRWMANIPRPEEPTP